MIQDIAPHAYEHDYNHDDPMPDDFVLAFRGREVAEEVGLCAANIRYAGSQPWGMDGDLLLGYFCDVEGPNEIRRFDHEELSVARWVDRSEVAQPPNTRTLTYDMIERFRTGRETR